MESWLGLGTVWHTKGHARILLPFPTVVNMVLAKLTIGLDDLRGLFQMILLCYGVWHILLCYGSPAPQEKQEQ